MANSKSNYPAAQLGDLEPDFVSETIENYQRVVVSLVFIGLGIYIMMENGTIQTLLGL